MKTCTEKLIIFSNMSQIGEMFTADKNTPPKTILSKSFSAMTLTSKQVTFAKNPQTISHIFEGSDIVENYLESIVLQNNGLSLVRNHKILMRQDHELMTDKVKILSGGSARFEPLYSGFVGPGILTASVFGEYSSSPSYLSILAALRLLGYHHAAGVLVIVRNNTADRLNFGLACQQALREGIKTMCLTVGEDCSGAPIDKTIGRRGLCGILFLYKVAGAMSEDNKTLYEIYCILRALKGGSLGTVNVGIEHDGIVIGLGLKGEQGKFSQHHSIPLIINEALFYIFNPASYFSLHIETGDNIAVIVNNLGKLSDFHLALIVKEICSRISFLGINVVRIYSGRFLTTKAVGFSVSVLKVNEKVLHWLDSPACVICWPTKISKVAEVPMLHFEERCFSYFHETESLSWDSSDTITLEQKNIGPRFSVEEADLLVAVLEIIVVAIRNMEEYLNKVDFDHDYGTNINKFMKSITQVIDERSLNVTTPYGLFNSLAELAATSMGGVSGAVFSVIFSASAQVSYTHLDKHYFY